MGNSGQVSELKPTSREAKTTASWRVWTHMHTLLGGSWELELGEKPVVSLWLDHLYTCKTLTPKSLPHIDTHLDSVSTWVLSILFLGVPSSLDRYGP